MKNHNSRLGLPAALFIAIGLAGGAATTRAQSTTNSSAPDQGTPDQEIVKMSQFEVTTTQGHGYVSTNAATAFKTNESLMDIPQGDVVVTNDLIHDLNYENTTDILQYFGVNSQVEGETMSMRGSGVAYALPYVDELPQFAFYQDDAVIDSFEVIKGATQVLYLNAPLSGIILKTTKKPLPFNQEIVTGSIDQNGLYRVTGDFTGPLGKIGDAEIGYRLVGLYQHGHEYFQNVTDDRALLFPEFQVKYHNTTARIYYNLQTIHSTEQGISLATLGGELYTGAGRKNGNEPPNNMPEWEDKTLYLEILQKISGTWENRLSAGYWQDTNFGPGVTPLQVEWDNDTETFTNRISNEKWHFWTVLDDWQGHYDLNLGGFPMVNRDAFGFGFSSQTDKQAYWSTAPFPYPNGTPGGTITVPINSAAAINAIVAPPTSAYPPPASGAGALNEIELYSIYWQHTVDVIPNWLTLIAGFTWDTIDTQSIPDWSVLPFQSITTPDSQWVHRLGAVVHLTKSISLYGLDSTTFTPPPTGSLTQSRQQPPNLDGTGTELGVKWNFMGGKISGETAWFRSVQTNSLDQNAGVFPNGASFVAVIGSVTEEGVDGDAAFTLMPGWQVIGTFYAGHSVDPFGNPVPYSYDNSWSTFTRYDFNHAGPLHGLSIAGGVCRVGSRWIPIFGVVDTAGPLPSMIRLKTGTVANGLVSYSFNNHLMVRVSCANVLDQVYAVGSQGPTYNDPSPPRTWSLEMDFKL